MTLTGIYLTLLCGDFLHCLWPLSSLFIQVGLLYNNITLMYYVLIKIVPSFLKLNLQEIQNIYFYIGVLQILLIVAGIEINPGPDRALQRAFTFAVWNLDSLPARDFARIPLIEAFQATYDFDLFGVCIL